MEVQKWKTSPDQKKEKLYLTPSTDWGNKYHESWFNPIRYSFWREVLGSSSTMSTSSEGKPVYFFQDTFSGHTYFYVCYCRKCVRRKCSERRSCCYPDKKDPDIEKKEPPFTSSRSYFDGHSIPSDWVEKPKPKPKLSPYYQKCLEILDHEGLRIKPSESNPIPQICMFKPEDFPLCNPSQKTILVMSQNLKMHK